MSINKILKTIVLSFVTFISLSVTAANITGAGATFPFPIYSKWAEAYKAETGIGLNYQSIGSSGGVRQIKAKTVDFGASDKPLSASELEKFGMMQFPAIIGGVVPVINLEGIAPGELKLTADIISGIHLGKIKNWNDTAITALNPDLNLPSSGITVVHRADGSGTTFLWTDYLSKANEDFSKVVGAGKAVKWPTGIGGKGNEGVANNVKRIKGSFGYVEYAYAKRNKIPHASLKNLDGNFVQPSASSFAAAAASADWNGTPGMGVLLTNQPGEESWPAAGASFIIMFLEQKNAITARAVFKFFDWCFKNGDGHANELDYVPMPDKAVALVKKAWSNQIKDSNGNQIWTK